MLLHQSMCPPVTGTVCAIPWTCILNSRAKGAALIVQVLVTTQSRRDLHQQVVAVLACCPKILLHNIVERFCCVLGCSVSCRPTLSSSPTSLPAPAKKSLGLSSALKSYRL